MSKRIPLQSSKKLKEIATSYYQDLDAAAKDPNQKVAWCSSVGPAEILLAMGFKVYYPENHSAMIGASRLANEFIPVSIAQGYSPEICSYLTSDIGAFLRNETPLTKAYGISEVPRPDVLVFNTNQCRDVQDWFNWYSLKLDVPIVGINSPTFIDEVANNHIDSVVDQMKNMIIKLEQITDQSIDKNELAKRVNISFQCSQTWQEVLKSAATIPSPLTFFDGCIHMLPAVVLRGEQIAVDYYQILKEELNERIEKGIAAVPEEKYRVYMEGMPIWGKLRALSEQFSDLKTCVVASTYCSSWIFKGFGDSPNDPLMGMAKAYTELFINRSESSKEEYLKRECEKFKIDGIVYHNARTCPNNSNTNYGMPKRLENQTGIPSLQIDADLNDLNVYSEEQTITNIEAFIEQLSGI
ncbi:MAG: 2-hydroxyacyl-CoA dehydratase subunit D [Candidatus Hodarchaeales archaeon]|jgi:benzoyl-CoA reductase/2-hydroxyglutaryl-CoA dehydratase subunit BcrC/BadD/HgdB